MKQQSPSHRVDEAPTVFGELIDSLSERGRALLGRRIARSAIPQVDLSALCELLLSRRGEASGVALAQALLDSYAAASAAERLDFLPLGPLAEDGKADSLWQLVVLQGAVGEAARADVLAYAAPTYYGMLVAEIRR